MQTAIRIFVATLLAMSAAAAEDGEWVSLFNGKDLDGWTPKIRTYEYGDNYADTFRVEDGAITVSYDKYDGPFNERFGHLFYKAPYANYKLKIEYRFIGEQCEGGPGWAWRNSGAMLHCQDPKTMLKDQEFPVSIEVQMLAGKEKGKRATGNLCTPGTHVLIEDKLEKRHCINSSSDTLRGDQWVTLVAEVHGHGVVKHYINDELVLEYEQSQLDEEDDDAKRLIEAGADIKLSSGYISLQSESHPVQFRKVEIMELDE